MQVLAAPNRTEFYWLSVNSHQGEKGFTEAKISGMYWIALYTLFGRRSIFLFHRRLNIGDLLYPRPFYGISSILPNPRGSPAVHLLWKQCCVWRGALCEDDSWSAFGLLWWLHRESLCEANINSQAPNQRCLIMLWNILTDPEIGVQSYFLSNISFKIRIFTIIIFRKPRQHKDSKKVGFITMIWSINTQRLKAVKEFESKPKRWVESIWCQPSLGHYA